MDERLRFVARLLEGEKMAPLCRWKFDRNHNRPWSMAGGMTGWPVVVPLESLAKIVGESDVVAIRVGVASKDVDEALLDAVHAHV